MKGPLAIYLSHVGLPTHQPLYLSPTLLPGRSSSHLAARVWVGDAHVHHEIRADTEVSGVEGGEGGGRVGDGVEPRHAHHRLAQAVAWAERAAMQAVGTEDAVEPVERRLPHRLGACQA